MMKPMMLFIMLVLVQHSIWSQTTDLQVSIIDQNGTPIREAVVDISSLHIGSFTDSTGSAIFAGIDNTTTSLDIRVSHLLYVPVRIQIYQPMGFEGSKLTITLYQEIPKKSRKGRYK